MPEETELTSKQIKKLETSRQDRFIELYLGEHYGNATRAAIGAGYSKHTAGPQGSFLLRNPKVRAKIEEQKKIMGLKSNLTAQMIIDEYRALALSNVMDYTTITDDGDARVIDLTQMTRSEAAAVAEIHTESFTEDAGDFDSDGNLVTKKRTVTKTKFKLHPKTPALEALAKYLNIPGIGTTKVEFTNPDGSMKTLPALVVQFITPGLPGAPQPKQLEGK